MNPYDNLSSEQQRVQKLADHFNADEQLWRRLEGKRRLRRKLYPRLPAKLRKQLDLLDFAMARQPQDCVSLFPSSRQPEEVIIYED